MTTLQRAIRERAQARRQYEQAKAEERRQSRDSCPDDQTIYEVYITEERWCYAKHTVFMVKAALEEVRARRRR